MPLRSLRGRRGAAVAVLLLVLALSVVLGIRARAGVQALGRASAAVNALAQLASFHAMPLVRRSPAFFNARVESSES